jgi:competence ComEA-like helix-hairpin-helix protein
MTDISPQPPDPAALPPRHWANWLFILTVCFLAGVVRTWREPHEVSAADRGPGCLLALVDQTVDPNSAPWWELAQLPGIGEKIAQAIVEFRSARKPPVFRKIEDLDAVPRIGPKTIEKITPYIRFPTDPPPP